MNWIAVKKELPPKITLPPSRSPGFEKATSGDVLVAYRYRKNEPWFVTISQCLWFNDEPVWRCKDPEFWMPLPEPPMTDNTRSV